MACDEELMSSFVNGVQLFFSAAHKLDTESSRGWSDADGEERTLIGWFERSKVVHLPITSHEQRSVVVSGKFFYFCHHKDVSVKQSFVNCIKIQV